MTTHARIELPPTRPRNDCPVCSCEWDRGGFGGDELTRARLYHVAAFHTTEEMLDAIDSLWTLVSDLTGEMYQHAETPS